MIKDQENIRIYNEEIALRIVSLRMALDTESATFDAPIKITELAQIYYDFLSFSKA